MSDLPVRVSWSEVRSAILPLLRLEEGEIHHISKIMILPDRIEVTQHRRVEGMGLPVHADGPVTTVTQIKVDMYHPGGVVPMPKDESE